MSNQTNCEACGAPLAAGARVCESCGQAVSGAGGAGSVSAESWSQPSPPGPSSSHQSPTDRWGSVQGEGSADDPGRWGSPQAKPASSPPAVGAPELGDKSFGANGALASATQATGNRKKWLVIGGIALVLGCLCLMLVVIISGGAVFGWLSSTTGGGF